MTIKRHTVAAAAIALTAIATVTSQPAVAAEQRAAGQSAVVCPTGYLCLQPSSTSARPVLVREGTSRSFSGGLRVSEVSNRTSVAYCITSQPYNYALSPSQSAVRAHTVLSVRPGGVCLT
ncbi:hypothetical protein [Nonomuraea sp. SYSU D8015]|uniref:hypothetical protein n=1 Tax=Nonomuraea sp. SYSU D8015 TaxID=2593644 RepID=UPI0016610EED|nr:hypothetical protein [Nonomuraea sp. SYSU D8015]